MHEDSLADACIVDANQGVSLPLLCCSRPLLCCSQGGEVEALGETMREKPITCSTRRMLFHSNPYIEVCVLRLQGA